MNYKYRIFFLIILISLFNSFPSFSKDSKYVNLELISRIYRTVEKQFFGDFDSTEIFENSIEKINTYLKEKNIDAEIEEFKSTGDKEKDLQLFLEKIDTISSDYETEEITKGDIIREGIDGLLEGLNDPYTYYMSPDEFKEFMASLNMNEYSGIGIFVELDKKNSNRLTVIEVFQEGPAYEVGLEPGDIILKIDGKDTEGFTLDEGTGLLRGKAGTDVTLTVQREEEIIELTITRDKIQIKGVSSRLIDGRIGYIKLRTFGEKTAEELTEALEEFEREGAEAYIIDLRNNGGGLVGTSIDICSRFLPENDPVVTVKEKENFPMEYKARGGYITELPLVILVNEFSASASEITAGAIQDNKRGILIGTRTFGKGSVQTIYPLDISGVLKITSAHYFTPSDKNIDKEGLMPDMEIEMNQYFVGEEEKDIQLQKAIEFLNSPDRD